MSSKSSDAFPVSKIQTLELEKIRATTFKGFDGPAMADQLLSHRNLWSAVMFSDNSLRPLVGMEKNKWKCYRIQILSSSPYDPKLEKLGYDLGADAVTVLTHPVSEVVTVSKLKPLQQLVELVWWE